MGIENDNGNENIGEEIPRVDIPAAWSQAMRASHTQVVPVAETCDNKDNNCNGVTGDDGVGKSATLDQVDIRLDVDNATYVHPGLIRPPVKSVQLEVAEEFVRL